MKSLFFLFLSFGAFSQDSTDYVRAKNMDYMKLASSVNCEESLSSTLEERICANLAFQRVDTELRKKLREMYDKLKSLDGYKAMNDSTYQSLVSFQKKWILERRQKSENYMGEYTGNAGGARYYQSMTLITEERLMELEGK